MSGQWWESDLIVGPFANITEANAWAAVNPSSLFLGLPATISGVPYSWGGAGVGWINCDSHIYTPATLPSQGGYIGQQVNYANVMAPNGCTRIYWTGARWCPVDGAVIASMLDINGIASLTDIGADTLVQVYQSPILDDLFLADGNELYVSASLGIRDPSSSIYGAMVGICISGELPTSTDDQAYAASRLIATLLWTDGLDENYPRKILRHGSGFLGRSGNRQELGNGGIYPTAPISANSFVAGSTRIRAMAIPKAATNIITLYSVTVRAGRSF